MCRRMYLIFYCVITLFGLYIKDLQLQGGTVNTVNLLKEDVYYKMCNMLDYYITSKTCITVADQISVVQSLHIGI